MLTFLQNFKIGTRIGLVLLLPVIGLLYFSGVSAMSAYRSSVSASHIVELADMAPYVSNLVHELQKERGKSAGFISSQGKKFADTLPGQRQNTDAVRAEFNKALKTYHAKQFGEQFMRQVQTAQTALAQLADKRQEVDALALPVAGMAAYYTKAITRLLTIVEEMILLSDNVAIANNITAYTAFLQAKEQAGLERAMGSAGFGAGEFKPAIYQTFIGLIARQEVLFDQFRSHATDAQIAWLEQALSGAIVDQVAAMRKLALDSPVTGTTGQVDGPRWFNAMTQKIDLMKGVEDKLASALSQQAHQIETSKLDSFQVMLGTVLGVLLVIFALGFLVVRGITGPLSDMVQVMGRLSGGDMTVKVPEKDRKDEIGDMAGAVQIFKDNAVENKRLEEAAKARDEEIRAERRKARSEMADAFENSVGEVVGSLASAVSQLQAAASDLMDTASSAEEQIIAIQTSSSQASQNVQAVAAAAEEFSSSIDEINRQVSHSTGAVNSAVEKIELTNQQISGLDAKAISIGEVLSLINDIADKTNLLALNATIEAARAGDAGKGFAVVAGEVKNLAHQTGQATEQIAGHINAIQSETTQAVSAIGSIGDIILTLQSYAGEIDRAVTEQGGASTEITRNIADASQGAIEVAQAVGHVSEAVVRTGASAAQVQGTAESLAGDTDNLRQQATDFLSQLRSA